MIRLIVIYPWLRASLENDTLSGQIGLPFGPVYGNYSLNSCLELSNLVLPGKWSALQAGWKPSEARQGHWASCTARTWPPKTAQIQTATFSGRISPCNASSTKSKRGTPGDPSQDALCRMLDLLAIWNRTHRCRSGAEQHLCKILWKKKKYSYQKFNFGCLSSFTSPWQLEPNHAGGRVSKTSLMSSSHRMSSQRPRSI